MAAGLLGGPIAGIGAGLIGGVHRIWYGGYTAIPCGIATILAGLLGGIVYVVRKGELPSPLLAAGIATGMEVFHMLLVLLLGKSFSESLDLVKILSLPMIGANAIGLSLFAYIVKNLIRHREVTRAHERISSEAAMADSIQTKILPNATTETASESIAESSMKWLMPYMSRETHPKSKILFNKDDNADRLYYIQDGILRLTEINKTVSNNTVIGETGIFSPAHERTISAVCETDLVAYSIDRTALMEVAFDHPVLLSDLMQLSINRFCRNLRESIAEQERTKSELKIAHSIQIGMIPREFPVREEFEVYASMEPAKEVGGDLYDFFFIDDDNFCFIVGDVSGKGVPAALFMAISRTLLRTEALRGLPPNEILQNANNTLCPDNEECMFVTVFCGILNIRTGELQFANAGHNPPIVGGQQRSTEFLKLHSGFVLGTIPDFPYVTQEEKLDPGDYLYVYTDGVTEAMNLEEKLFSDARLLEIMKNIDNNPATEMLAVVKDEVKDFVKEAPQSDDITMLAVRFHGPKE